MMEDMTVLGPELFTNGDVISYKGENYYRACNALVSVLEDGGKSYCVKRVDHPGNVHEDYDGAIRREQAVSTDPSPILKYFSYVHLPESLKGVSAVFAELARHVDKTLPNGPEKSVALRKILEAKDAAVRSALDL